MRRRLLLTAAAVAALLLSSTAMAVEVAPSSAPVDALTPCRIPDQRPLNQQRIGGIAYPANSGPYTQQIPSVGTVKVAVIPIDFPDVPGKVTPEQMFAPHRALINDWLKWFSHDRLRYDIQMSDTWIRAPKPSTNYVWKQPWFKQPAGFVPKKYVSAEQLASTFLNLAQDRYDYTDLRIVLFMYPKEHKYQADALTRFAEVSVGGQRMALQLDATGTTNWPWNTPIWLGFLHENLHPHGLAGHAPGAGGALGIMQGPRTSLVATAWEQVILGWDSPDEIVCLDAKDVQAQEFSLSALEIEQPGTKAVMVRLSDHEVLVVEGHRQGRWAKPTTIFPIASERPKISGLPASFKGVTATLIDTTINVNRKGWNDKMFAIYLKVKGKDRNQGAPRLPDPFDWNVVLKTGDSVSAGGVRVTVVSQGATDRIRISKAA